MKLNARNNELEEAFKVRDEDMAKREVNLNRKHKDEVQLVADDYEERFIDMQAKINELKNKLAWSESELHAHKL